MNNRAKGQRNELRAQHMLEEQGYTVFRLYQPKFSAQGPLDFIAVNSACVRMVQVRTNQWHSLQALQQLVVPRQACITKEAWMFRDGQREPRLRLITPKEE